MNLPKACTQLLQTYLPKSPAPHLPSLPVPWEPERRVTLCCLSYILLGICSQPWQKLCSPWSRVENHLLGSLLLLVHSLLWHHKKLLWEVIEISSYKALQPTAVCLDAAEKLLLDREHRTSTLDLINWNLLISWTLTLGDFLFVGWILCSVVLLDTYTQCFLLRHRFLLMCSFYLIVPFKFFCHVLLWFHFSYFKPYLYEIKKSFVTLL